MEFDEYEKIVKKEEMQNDQNGNIMYMHACRDVDIY